MVLVSSLHPQRHIQSPPLRLLLLSSLNSTLIHLASEFVRSFLFEACSLITFLALFLKVRPYRSLFSNFLAHTLSPSSFFDIYLSHQPILRPFFFTDLPGLNLLSSSTRIGMVSLSLLTSDRVVFTLHFLSTVDAKISSPVVSTENIVRKQLASLTAATHADERRELFDQLFATGRISSICGCLFFAPQLPESFLWEREILSWTWNHAFYNIRTTLR